MVHSAVPKSGCGIAPASAETAHRREAPESRLVQRHGGRNSEDLNRETIVANSSCDRYMLWIDGVGAWQICVGSRFLIGGPTLEGTSPDICLMANLSRRHATLQRNGEDWFIHPYHSTVVSGRSVASPTLLRTGDAICLAERVRLGFRIPSILSGSAMIDFESHHRPNHSVNGIILMTDSVLLGPRKDHHVCCTDWPELVVIYRQDGQLRCRSKAAMSVNGDRVRDSAVLHDGAIVSGEDFRFRIEKLKG
jgi:hypothetical protein